MCSSDLVRAPVGGSVRRQPRSRVLGRYCRLAPAAPGWRVNPTQARLSAALAAPRFRDDAERWRDEAREEQAKVEQLYAISLTPEASSSLDHLGISDHSRENLGVEDTDPPVNPSARALYLAPDHELAEVERLTESHRRNRAARHAQIGRAHV